MENIRVKVLTKYSIYVNFAVKVQVSPQLLKDVSKNGRIKEGRAVQPWWVSIPAR